MKNEKLKKKKKRESVCDGDDDDRKWGVEWCMSENTNLFVCVVFFIVAISGKNAIMKSFKKWKNENEKKNVFSRFFNFS